MTDYLLSLRIKIEMCEKGASAANTTGFPIAEIAMAGSTIQSVPRCYPKFRGKYIFDGNPEALAWLMVSISSSMTYVGVGAFLASTILRLASSASKCHAENAASEQDLDELCGPSIIFVKPSSLLAVYSIVIGTTAAFMLPFIGAIIDFTSRRLMVGRIISVLFLCFLGPLMFLNKYNYVYVLACHGISVFIGWFMASIHFAYLPELTDNEYKLAGWTKSFTVWTYVSILAYLVGVIATVMKLGLISNDILTNRIGMGVVFVINAILVLTSFFFLFGERDPLHEQPPNTNTFTAGFVQLWNTAKKIKANYRALKWYYVHISFSDAGWQSFGIILLTYMSDFLDFNPLHNSISICLSLTGSIPGGVVGTFVARRLDPVRSARINNVLMICCIIFFVIIVNGPGQQMRCYIYFLFIGFCGGWKYTLDRLISSSIIPESQDAELMGVFLFVGQILLWLPLLTFTVLNEKGVSPQICVGSVAVFPSISLVFLCVMGSYSNARLEVGRSTLYKNTSDVGVSDPNTIATPNVPVDVKDAEGQVAEA